jgi:hypothetical protein
MAEFFRDLDGTGSMHTCAKGDQDAVAYVPLNEVLDIIQLAREGKIDSDLRSIRSRIENL